MSERSSELLAKARGFLEEKRFIEIAELCEEVLKEGEAERKVPECETEGKVCRYFCCQDEFLNYIALRQALGMDDKNVLWVWSNQAEAWYLRGYALIELGQRDKAIECLKTAVELNPANLQAIGELGYCFQMTKQWQPALFVYGALLRICRNLERFPEIIERVKDLTGESENFLAKRETEKANEMLRQLQHAYEVSKVLTSKYEARALRGMAYCLAECGLWQEAETAARESLLLDPNSKIGAGEIEYIMSMKQLVATDHDNPPKEGN